MSWNDYAEGLLIPGVVNKIAIFDWQNGGVWGTSTGFEVTPAEIGVIIDALKPATGNEDKWVAANGFTLAGEKFFFLRSDEAHLYGKKGKEGAVVTKAPHVQKKMVALIARYTETEHPILVNDRVDKIAEALGKVVSQIEEDEEKK